MSIKKFCNKPGCKNLCDISQRFCNDHIHLIEQQKAERNQHYDKKIRQKRDKQYTEFYHSIEWKKTREVVLMSYFGLDLYAYYVEHKITRSVIVHHIEEIKEAWELRLSLMNLIPLSEESHSHVHYLYKTDKTATQMLLRELLRKWNSEMRGRAGPKSFS